MCKGLRERELWGRRLERSEHKGGCGRGNAGACFAPWGVGKKSSTGIRCCNVFRKPLTLNEEVTRNSQKLVA